MNTCVICHMAFDPFCDEKGNILIDYETGICYKCQRKIENGEINVEDYDKHLLSNEKMKIKNKNVKLADSGMKIKETYTTFI